MRAGLKLGARSLSFICRFYVSIFSGLLQQVGGTGEFPPPLTRSRTPRPAPKRASPSAVITIDPPPSPLPPPSPPHIIFALTPLPSPPPPPLFFHTLPQHRKFPGLWGAHRWSRYRGAASGLPRHAEQGGRRVHHWRRRTDGLGLQVRGARAGHASRGSRAVARVGAHVTSRSPPPPLDPPLSKPSLVGRRAFAEWVEGR